MLSCLAAETEPQTVRVAFTVPANLEGEFRRMAEQWLEEIDKR